MDPKLRKGLLIGLVLGFLLYAALAFLADLRQVLSYGGSFPFLIIPAVLALATGNYLIRLVRWNYYLRALDIGLSAKLSAIVFFAGLSMSITPGKFGELLKAQYIKNIDGTARSRTGTVVIAERLTDLLGILFLASFGVFQLHYGQVVFFVCVAIILCALVIIASRSLSLGLLKLASRIPLVGKVAHKLEEAYVSVARLLSPAPLIAATVLATIAWGCECIGFYLVLASLPGLQITLPDAVFIYAFATVVGAVTMLPGGLITTEGTMTGLLLLLGIPAAGAVTATLITRLCTLWYAVALGLTVTLVWRRLLEGPQQGGHIPDAAP
jgi:uncharacterized protein (TIRG00374 family)